jgi:hypothetical protein
MVRDWTRQACAAILRYLAQAPADALHREHPEASEVFVTGTFDDWGKTQRLDKQASGFFEKTVALPSKDKVLYKVSKGELKLRATPTVSSKEKQASFLAIDT